MRIDAHQHFLDHTRFRYPWIPPGGHALTRDHLPDDMRVILRENRFDGSVVVQALPDPRETAWLLEVASEHPFVLGVVGWADLESPGLPAVLDELQAHPKFRGIRHPAEDEADDRWLLRDSVRRGLAELARRAIPFDLLVRPRHLPVVREVAERLPDLPLVIDHCAKPPVASGSLDGWAEDMERLAACPQIHVKLSGLVTEAGPGWTPQTLRPYLFEVFRHFPADRLMFGSDWPVCKMAGANWKGTLAAFTQAHGPMPAELRSKLIGETAARFYRLSPQQSVEPGPAPA